MIAILIIGILLIMFIWKMTYQKLWEKELSVFFSFEQPYVYAGESIRLKEIIENKKRMPVSPLEVRFRVKRGLVFQDMNNTSVSDYVYKRDLYALWGRQRIIRSLSVLCQKRGLYAIGDVSMVAYPIMLNQTYHKELDTEAQVYVYAKRTNVADILRASENLLGEQESNRKYLEDSFAFSSIRDYTMQDPMKSINWKASAKTGKLMVNTYTSVKNEKMMIYLDIEDSGFLKQENLKEESISIAATLYQKLLNKGTEAGICINLYDENSDKIFYLPPSRSKSHRTKLEQTLAEDWKEDAVADFEKVLEISPQDAIPVIISKNISTQRVRMAEALCGKKTKGIWVLPYELGEIPSVHSDCFLFVKREVER